MYLSGLIHRDELFDISMRWLGDALESEDSRKLTKIFAYEGFISTPYIKRFLSMFMERLHGKPVYFKPVYFKNEVKEAVIRAIPEHTPRLKRLIEQYWMRPEEYFPRAPVNGFLVYLEGTDELVAMFRMKRARRIAEKASRRIADLLFDHIQEEAKALARERAKRLGVPFDMLLTPQEEMVREFEAAERQLAYRFTSGTIPFTHDDLGIHDLLGIKVIGNEDILAKTEELIKANPLLSWIEREEHHGQYNAVNIQVDYMLPEPSTVIGEILGRGGTPPFPTTRGLSMEELLTEFPAYVESGARNVRMEIILTTYPELVESEIGRSIHEERTLRQRSERKYTGRIAKNAEFIIEYLLSVAFSPHTRVPGLPVKLHGHYLPETIAYAIRRLYGIEESSVFSTSYIIDV